MRLPMPLPLIQRARQLHVGLISSDFKRHPVAILLVPVLRTLVRLRRLRLTLFALNPPATATAVASASAPATSEPKAPPQQATPQPLPKPDPFREMASLIDGWVDLSNVTDAQAVAAKPIFCVVARVSCNVFLVV